MKLNGYVRKLDMLGRLVIPMEIRKSLSIKENDRLLFTVDGDTILIRKHGDSCYFCGNSDGLEVFHGKIVCTSCINELKNR